MSTKTSKFKLACNGVWHSFLMILPDEFSKFRVRYYNRRGCNIDQKVSISPNVRIRGLVEINTGSSVAQNCTISGEKAGVYIGKDVMIAPNVVIVAFNHGFRSRLMPMRVQKNTEEAIFIEDDVWISANCTIAKGVRIGKGSIIGANSFVKNDIPNYSIAAGVPAKVLTSRQK